MNPPSWSRRAAALAAVLTVFLIPTAAAAAQTATSDPSLLCAHIVRLPE